MNNADALPLFRRAAAHADRMAIVDDRGGRSYCELLESSAAVAAGLLAGTRDLNEQRVAFLVSPGFNYVAVQWGVWRAGGVAVPLGLSHPEPELDYVLQDADVSTVVADAHLISRIGDLVARRGLRLIEVDCAVATATRELPSLMPDRRAMILYTSGTTSRPKGVVTTHANIQAQVESLVQAWEWSADDRILQVLPLHHIHGIINALTCALWSGATCEMLPGFEAEAVCGRFASCGITLFMAVPTIYSKLIARWEQASAAERKAISAGCRAMRVMISGSAALPVPTLEKWRDISGHTLLERYGMTEIGMALSNPLHGTRFPGCVGDALPGVDVRRVLENGAPAADHEPAEVQIRGHGVFREYWNHPEATREAFVDGWFRTGDVTVVENGVYRILGRSSVDIIKTGGYKVSALEIEEVLRRHPDIRECAVVGVDDAEWGQRVAACVELFAERSLTCEALRTWCKEFLAPYKAPTLLKSVDGLPRNVMGKVQKLQIAAMFSEGVQPVG